MQTETGMPACRYPQYRETLPNGVSYNVNNRTNDVGYNVNYVFNEINDYRHATTLPLLKKHTLENYR